MFGGKKIRDSIAIAKQIKVAERNLHIDRKRTLFVLIIQTLLIIGLLVVQCIFFSQFKVPGNVAVLFWIGLILIAGIFGFNAIFYIDQTRLGPYKIANIALYSLLTISVIIQQTALKEEDYIDNNKQSHVTAVILNIVFSVLAILLDIILIILLNTLKSKWERTSEKSQLKSAVFSRDSYESMLQQSLVVDSSLK